MIKVMKEMEQDEADERKGVPRAFFTEFSDTQITQFLCLIEFVLKDMWSKAPKS